jgi:hypothetical protein
MRDAAGVPGANHATPWLVLVGAVAVHVTDEALTGFLDFYNPLVRDLRVRLGFFPMPTFTFGPWIGGLTVAILCGTVFTLRVQKGGRLPRIVCGVLSVLMLGNALGHLAGSVYFGRLLPGFWSSPLLLAASTWMLRHVIAGRWPSQVRA